MNGTLLKDPTVWHWRFFVRKHGSNWNIEEHWQDFSKALKEAVNWAGGREKLKGPYIEALLANRPIPDQFANIPFHPSNRFHISLQARSLLDSTYIQTAWGKQGEFDPEVFSHLRGQGWAAKQEKSSEEEAVWDATCLIAEVPQSLDESIDEYEEVVSEMLSSWFGNRKVEEVQLIKLQCGIYATAHDIEGMVWVLLVWDDKTSNQRATRLINRFAPPFQLAWLKGRYIREAYETKHSVEVNRLESELEKKINEARQQPWRLKKFEDESLGISLLQTELGKRVTLYKELVTTLRINIENLEALLTDPLYGAGAGEMKSLLVAPIMQSEGQIKADIEYKQITLDDAERVLREFERKINILSERWARQITIMVSLFAVFGAVQAFGSQAKWYGINAIWIAVGIIIIGSYLIWLYRRH
jgi:hypothetical protein